MDGFSRLFRSLLGVKEPNYRSNKEQEQEPDSVYDDLDENPRNSDMSGYFDDMFSSFHDMINTFADIQALHVGPHLQLEIDLDTNNSESSLRDQMLKEPESNERMWNKNEKDTMTPDIFNRFWKPQDWQRQAKEDTDLDEIVKCRGLEAINLYPQVKLHSNDRRSNFRCVSISTKLGPDGRSEKHETYRDSKGNETSVVKKSIDGKTFTETKTKKENGEIEVTENWSAMNADEKKDFLERWNSSEPNKFEFFMKPSYFDENFDGKTESIFQKLFGKF